MILKIIIAIIILFQITCHGLSNEFSITDFKSFKGLELVRQYNHQDSQAKYSFYEYSITTNSLENIENSIKKEVNQFGGKILYPAEFNMSSKDISMVISLPVTKGTRKINIYSPIYNDQQQHLVVQETTFFEQHDFSLDNAEDIVILRIPMIDLSYKEIYLPRIQFPGTDVFLADIVGQEFFSHLDKESNSIKLSSKNIEGTNYFNKEGHPVDIDSDNGLEESYYFGIDFPIGTLPEDKKKKDFFLSCYAWTMLVGIKSVSGDVELQGGEFDFLEGEKFLKTFSQMDYKDNI